MREHEGVVFQKGERMVETLTKRRIQAWYLCALLHYQGKVNNQDQWCVALLRKHVTTNGVQTKWEFLENMDFESATEMLEYVKPRLVRCTPGDLKKVIAGMPDAG